MQLLPIITVLLRAAADAIEAQSDQSDAPVNRGSIWVTTPKGFRQLKKGEAIWASDIYQQAHGKFANAETDSVGRQYDPAHYLPHFRPV